MPTNLNFCRKARLALPYLLCYLVISTFDSPVSAACPDTVIRESRREWHELYGNIKREVVGLRDSHRKDVLKGVLANLDSLDSSFQKYGLHHIDTNPGSSTYDIRHDIVLFNIQSHNTANFVHETTHGKQFQKGGIVYRDTLVKNMDLVVGGVGDDFEDEIEAYQAQFAYDSSSVSGLTNLYYSKVVSPDSITVIWLLGLVDSSGNQIYKPNGRDGIAAQPINIYSDKKAMKAAYPFAPGVDELEDNYILGNDAHYLNYPAKRCKCRLNLQP